MAVRRVDAYRRAGFDWVVDGDIEFKWAAGLKEEDLSLGL